MSVPVPGSPIGAHPLGGVPLAASSAATVSIPATNAWKLAGHGFVHGSDVEPSVVRRRPSGTPAPVVQLHVGRTQNGIGIADISLSARYVEAPRRRRRPRARPARPGTRLPAPDTRCGSRVSSRRPAWQRCRSASLSARQSLPSLSRTTANRTPGSRHARNLRGTLFCRSVLPSWGTQLELQGGKQAGQQFVEENLHRLLLEQQDKSAHSGSAPSKSRCFQSAPGGSPSVYRSRNSLLSEARRTVANPSFLTSQ